MKFINLWILSIMASFSIHTLATELNGESKTFSVKGMHCSGCVESIKEKVCDNHTYSKCNVEMGRIDLTPLPGTHIDEALVKKQVKKAGHYRVTQVSKELPSNTKNTEKMDPSSCPENSGNKDDQTCKMAP